MLEIAALVVTIVGVILAATSHGSILGRLWHAFKVRFGRTCRSITFLHGLGRQQLSNDLHRMFTTDLGLKSAVQQFYLPQIQRPPTFDPFNHFDHNDQYDKYDEYDEYDDY